MRLNEKFELHEDLNPKIWKNNELMQDVEQRLYDIAELFIEECSIGIADSVCDVVLVGSNASFNYTESSDIDLHIVVNFELIDENIELVQAAMNLEKSSFNSNYDITVKGIPVEVYVEDVNASTISNGIYSIQNHDWVKFPKPIQVKNYDLSMQTARWCELIDNALSEGNEKAVTDCINTLYMIRKNSISADGEYGPGNALFKDIRSMGKLDELKDALKEIRSSNLTLEDLNWRD